MRGRATVIRNVHRLPPEGIGWDDLSDECKEEIEEHGGGAVDAITDDQGLAIVDEIFEED